MTLDTDHISGMVFVYNVCEKCGYDEREEMQTTASTKAKYFKWKWDS